MTPLCHRDSASSRPTLYPCLRPLLGWYKPVVQLGQVQLWSLNHLHGEESPALIDTHWLADNRKFSLACWDEAVGRKISEAICVCDRPWSPSPADPGLLLFTAPTELDHWRTLTGSAVSQGSERNSFQALDV